MKPEDDSLETISEDNTSGLSLETPETSESIPVATPPPEPEPAESLETKPDPSLEPTPEPPLPGQTLEPTPEPTPEASLEPLPESTTELTPESSLDPAVDPTLNPTPDQSLEPLAPAPVTKMPEGSSLSGIAGKKRLIPKFHYNKKAILVSAVVLVFVTATIAGGAILANLQGSKKVALSNAQKIANFGVSSLTLSSVKTNQQLQVGEADHLAVNGQLRVSNTLVLTPTTQPSSPTVGQIYYDQTTNAPYYYNGTQFISLSPPPPQHVTSISGASGALNLGSGLSLGGQILQNTGVLSITGTADQIITTGSTGNLTLSLPQNIGTDATPNFAGLTVPTLTARSGDSGLVIGDNSQDLTLQGANTTLSDTSGGFTNQLVFQTPTGNNTITIPDIGGTICTTSNNCASVRSYVSLQGSSPGTPDVGSLSVTGTVGVGTLGATGATGVCLNASNELATCIVNPTNVTFQSTYQASGTAPQINLNSTNGGITIADNATPVGGNLLAVTNNSGSTTYFGVTASGISTSGTITGNGSGITNLSASNISTGTLNDARLDGTVTVQGNSFNAASELVQLTNTGVLPVLSGINLTNLNASNLASGTVPDARLSANVTVQGNTFNGVSELVQTTAGGILPVLSGANLTNLNASNINSGILAVAEGGTGAGNASGARANLGAAVNGANNDITSLTDLTAITPPGALTIGANSQNLTLQGGIVTLTDHENGFFSEINFTTPTQNRVITVPDDSGYLCLSDGNCNDAGGPGANSTLSNLANVALNVDLVPAANGFTNLGTSAKGFGNLYVADASNTYTYDLTGATTTANKTITIPSFSGSSTTLCLSTGNCAGSGSSVTTTGGTVNTIPVYSGTQAIGNSIISQDVGATTATVSGALSVTGTLGVTGVSTLTGQLNANGGIVTNNANINAGTGTITGNGSGLTNLNGSNISSGTVADARLTTNVTLQGNTFNGNSQLVQLTNTGILPVLSGLNLTNLNGSNISSGTVADNRLSSNVALQNGTNIFTGTNNFKPTSDSATAFRIQNAAGSTTLFNADTTGSGALTFGVASTFSSTLAVNTLGSAGNTAICLNGSHQIATCTTNPAGVTLQQAYNASTSPDIVLSSGVGGLIVQDSSTPIGGNLLAVQSNGGGTTYLGVTASGTSVAGTFSATSTITGTTLNGTTGINTGAGSGTQRIDSSGNLVNIGNITSSGALTVSSGGGGLLTLTSGSGNIATSNTINSQTISSAANFTGTVALATLGASGNTAVCQNGSNQLSVCGTNVNGVTLQQAYNASTSPDIVLSSGVGGLVVQDASTPIGGNLLAVQSNGGGTNYLTVSAAGVGIGAPVANGLLTVGTSTTTASGGLYFGTDTDLYRSAANTLQTDSAVVIQPTSNPIDALIVSPTINTSTVNARDIFAGGTFTGSGDGPGGLASQAVFSPSANIVKAYGFINIANGNPGVGINIGTLDDGLNRIITGSSGGTITTSNVLILDTPTYGTVFPGTVNGALIQNQGAAGITTDTGLNVAAQTGATTDIGVKIAAATTYSLQLAGTGGTASNGIEFGTDTDLYRSAASVLKTDSAFIAGGTASTNSATEFQVQNASGTAALNVNTSTLTTTLQAGTDTGTIGSSLVTCTDFTNTNSPCTGSQWTTTGWTAATTTATHNTGNTSALSTSEVVPTSSSVYQVSYTISGTPASASTLSVTFGGVTVATYTFSGNTASANDARVITATNGNALTFTPGSTFNGIISNVAVKLITSNANPVLIVKNASGTSNIAIRASSDSNSTFIGNAAGGYNSSGVQDTALGANTLNFNTSGGFNVAVGFDSLQLNTTGNNSTALGYQTLQDNTSGSNTAVGAHALDSNTIGTANTAVGTSALAANVLGGNDTAFGADALQSTTATGNVAVGVNALQNATSGNNSAAFGTSALGSVTIGGSNTAVGYQAGVTATSANATTTGSFNTFLGFQAGPGSTLQVNDSTALGMDSTVNQSNAIILGCTNTFDGCTSTTTVGIGSQYAPNALTVSPGTYGTNVVAGSGTTITQTTTAITGSGTTFTSAMTGGTIYYSDGTTGTVTYVSATSLTSSVSKTVSAGSSYTIVYGGFNVTANGTAYLQPTTDSTTAFQLQNASGGQLLNVDSVNSIISIAGNNSGAVGAWTEQVGALGTARQQHSSVVANGYIYNLGGSQNPGALSSVQYAPITSSGAPGSWTTASQSLPAAVYDGAAVTANSYVYYIGGYNGTTTQSTVYYAKLNADGSTGAWTTSSNPLPAGRANLSAVVINGYVYAIAGGTADQNNGSAQSTVYYAKLNADGSTGAWTTSSNPLPSAIIDFPAVATNGYIYTFGGYISSGGNTSTVYYAKVNNNGSTGAWTTSSQSLPVALRLGNSVVINGYVYYIGGYGSAGSNAIYYAKLNADGSTGAWTTNSINQGATSTWFNTAVTWNGYVYQLAGLSLNSNVWYASTERLEVGGSLDLVGSTSQGSNSDQSGGSLTAGNTNVLGTFNVSDQANFLQGVSVDGALNVASSVLFDNTSNSTVALQVQNAAGANLLQVDTTNTKLTVGQGNLVVTGVGVLTTHTISAGSNQGGSLSGAAGTTYYYKITALNNVGESFPSSEASINGASFTPLAPPAAPTVANDVSAGNLNGTYLYKITFVTTNGETTGGTTSASVSPVNQEVDLSAIPTGPTGTTARKIYRTVAGGADGTQQLVTTISDNTTTTYTDNTADGSLGASLPVSNTATTNTNNATITFTPITGATSYNIYRGTSSGGESAYQNTTTSPFTDTGAAGTSATVPTVDATARLGVGTASPTANLQVVGTALFQTPVNTTSAFRILDSSGTSVATVDTTTDTLTVDNLTVSGTCTGCGSSGTVSLQSAYTAGGSITTTNAKNITFNLDATGTPANFVLQNAGTNVLQVSGTNGAVTAQNSVNSSTAFVIQNAGGSNNTDNLIDLSTVYNAANLVSNGSFEQNTNGWAAEGNMAISQDSTQGAPFGSSDMKITNSGTPVALNGAKYVVNMTNNTVYGMSFYAKSAAAFSTLTMGFSPDGSTNSTTGCSTAYAPSTTVWLRFNCSFTYTGTTNNGVSYIFIGQNDTTARTWYVDGVDLEQIANGAFYREGQLNWNGIALGATLIQPAANSNVALRVTGTSGLNGLNVDTSGSLLTTSFATTVSSTLTLNTSSTTELVVHNSSTAANLFALDTSTINNNDTNGGFENSTTGYTTNHAGVTLTADATAGNAYEGLNTGKLVVTTSSVANSGIKYNLTTTTMVSSTAYTLSFYAKLVAGQSAFTTLTAGTAQDGATETACTLNSNTVTTFWQRYTCTFTTGTTSGTPYLYFGQTDAGVAHSYYLDNIQFTPSSFANNNYHEGKIQLNGVITSPTIFQPNSDGTGVFQIQDANGTNELNIDTTTNNLLLNSGFGIGSGGWTTKGTDSSFGTDSTAGNVYQGSQSLKAIVTAATSGVMTNSGQAAFSTNILANTQYQLTFFAKCDSTYNTLTYGRQDVSGTDVNSTTSGTCTTNWQQYTAHWTTGGTITNPDIYVDLGSTTAGTIWLDSVSLVQTNTSIATNYNIGNISLDGVITSPTIFQNTANSTLAFQVQNAAGTTVFNVDTQNQRVGIGTNAPGNLLSIGALTTAAAGYQIAVSTGGVSNSGIVVQTVASQSSGYVFQAQSSTGSLLAAIDYQGNLTVQAATINGALTVNGHIITGNTSGSTTAAVNANAGTSATCNVSGNDTGGQITLVTGSSAWASGAQCAINFSSSFGSAPHPVISSANPTLTSSVHPYVTSATGSFTINFAVGDTGANTYVWNYFNAQ